MIERSKKEDNTMLCCDCWGIHVQMRCMCHSCSSAKRVDKEEKAVNGAGGRGQGRGSMDNATDGQRAGRGELDGMRPDRRDYMCKEHRE